MKKSLILIIFTLFSFSQCKVKPNGSSGGDIQSLPSEQDVKDHLDDILTGPVKDCGNIKVDDGARPSNFPNQSPVVSARKILAAKYQSCRILDNIEGASSFDGPQPDIIYDWKKQTPPLYPSNNRGCIDSTKLPVEKACSSYTTKFGKRICVKSVYATPMHYSQAKREMPVKNGKIEIFRGASDCSSFVTSAFRASGLKMNMNSTLHDVPVDTTYMIGDAVKKGNSCFDRPILPYDNPIASGDVIDTQNQHVVMIDEVGNDPFNTNYIFEDLKTSEISKADALKECQKINPSRFNLTIIHSTNSHGSSGIMRQRANKLTSGTAIAMLDKVAKNHCIQFVNNYPNTSKGYNPNYGAEENQFLLRHKGKSEPRCIYENVPKIEGEECINECIENYI
jgi:hypothetical protein